MSLKLVSNPPLLNKQGLWILPDQTSCLYLRQQFLEKKQVLVGEKFITFQQFIKNIANPRLPVMSVSAQILLIYQLLSSCQLAYFKSTHLGLARQAANTINLLKNNLFDINQLQTIVNKQKYLAELDFLKLYKKYEETKKSKNILDEADLFILAFEQLKQSTFLQSMKEFFFDKFHYFSPGQIELIKHLSKTFSILINFPTPKQFDLTCQPYLQKTWSELKKIADEINSSPQPGHDFPESGVLKTTKGAELSSVAKPQVYMFRSMAQENQYLTQQLQEFLQEKIDPKQIGICVRKNSEQTLDILEEIFKESTAKSWLNLSSPLTASFTHHLFSEEVLKKLPNQATLTEFCNHLAANLKKMPHIKTRKENTNDKYWTRTIICLNKISGILQSLQAQTSYFELPAINKKTFFNFLELEFIKQSNAGHDYFKISPFNLFFFENTLPENLQVLLIPQMQGNQYPTTSEENIFFNYENLTKRPQLQEIFLSPAEKLCQEHFFWQRLIKNTNAKIIITFSQTSLQGRELKPSYYLEEFDQAKPIVLKSNNRLLEKNPALKNRLQRIGLIELERDFGYMHHPEYHGLISNPELKKLIKTRFIQEALSPSQIEKYAQCPFKFFLEKVLNLKPDKEITPEIQARDLGSIIHAVLERFYSNNLDLFKNIVFNPKKTNEIKQIIIDITDALFEEYKHIIDYSAPCLRDLEKNKVVLLTEQIICLELDLCRQLEEPILPLKSEWKFGQDLETCLRLEIAEQEPALIQGRLDRIDVNSDCSKFLVIDYKSGNTSSVINDIKQGLHFQIPIYVQAVRKLLLPNSIPMGGMLISVKAAEKKHGLLKKQYQRKHFDVGRSRSLLNDEQWEDIIENSLNQAASLVAKIREADFRVEPTNCPKYCDYENICRFNDKNINSGSEAGN